MKDLAAAYPNFKASERQTRVYAAALADLHPDDVRRAMGRAIIESRWFPSCAEIRGYVTAPTDDLAQRAWLLLRAAASDIGAWKSCVIDDACAAIALKQVAGSWPAFCAIDEGPALLVMRQGFLASYRDARRRMHGGASEPIRLAGLCESGAIGTVDVTGWIGHVTLDGDILTERDAPPLLSAPVAPRQLPAGTNEPLG